MRLTSISLLAAASALALAACDRQADGNNAATGNAAEAAGDATIADGLTGDRRFAEAAKSAGLDRTLDGPGPYTVLVPSDAAFDKLPAGALDTLMKPESRAELTRLLTFHVLPGTILAEDIGKAIDNGGGKASLATMGGGTLTATKEGNVIVLADAAGGKARVTQADDKRSNGVIHRVDGVLMPS
ncbi:MAG TPA: fasciclin domain-containing protein [Sphingomicrobium sp.]|nr:fasciclin domain-containing protein [Sphingomicrobium sp.]